LPYLLLIFRFMTFYGFHRFHEFGLFSVIFRPTFVHNLCACRPEKSLFLGYYARLGRCWPLDQASFSRANSPAMGRMAGL
jgi:hypothetical protein